jgi:hypothetical protein
MFRTIGIIAFVSLVVMALLLWSGNAELLFALMVILLALSAIVGTMVVVLSEKRDHDAPLRYVRSPWIEETETPAEPVTADSHAPLSEHVTPADEEKTP